MGSVGDQRLARLHVALDFVEQPSAALDRALETVEHRIQRLGEVGKLVAYLRHSDPLGQIVDPDLLCPSGHPLDWP